MLKLSCDNISSLETLWNYVDDVLKLLAINENNTFVKVITKKNDINIILIYIIFVFRIMMYNRNKKN